MTEALWASIAPLIPPTEPCGRERHLLVDTLGMILATVVRKPWRWAWFPERRKRLARGAG